MKSRWLAAVIRRLPRQEVLLATAWAATLVPLAAFGYLTSRSIDLLNDISSLEDQKRKLEMSVTEREAQRVEALVSIQEGKLANAEDALLGSPASVVPPPRPPRGSREPTSRRAVVDQLFDPDARVRVKAYGDLMPVNRREDSLISELLDAVRQHARDDKSAYANGVYNVLVVLSHMDEDVLAERSDELRGFARTHSVLGPRIKARVDTLLERLPPAK
jgi:hypothetical protein